MRIKLTISSVINQYSKRDVETTDSVQDRSDLQSVSEAKRTRKQHA